MIDSHCHLNFNNIKEDIDNIILKAKKNKVSSILSINTHPNEFNEHMKIIDKYKNIYISYGLHPQEINSNTKFTLNDIFLNINHPKVIGLGETGLDFYHSKEFKKKQYEIFEIHIEGSIKYSLPLIIHQRNSENEIIDVIKNYQKDHKLSIVFHCFS